MPEETKEDFPCDQGDEQEEEPEWTDSDTMIEMLRNIGFNPNK